MSTTASRLLVWVCLASMIACGGEPRTPIEAESRYGFGRPASAEELGRAEIDVRFDGQGLPPGRGSAAEGAPLYRDRCATCHGSELEGNPALGVRPLVGEIRHAVNNLPFAPPLFGYIRRAMPLEAPGSLSDSEVYSLVAFLLTRAGVVASPDLTLEAASLAAVEMPNRVNFVIAEGVGLAVPEPARGKKAK